MALIDVVRWEGTPDVFAWKFPENNLTTFTQLIVNESQEAVLFHKGALLSKFGPGKHTLSTENIPLLENLFGIPFGGQNPFTAEVWFVNRVASLDVKWGTLSPLLVRDPEFGVMIPVRGFGQFGIRIDDAEKFLVQLVGTLPAFGKERLVEYFRGLLLSRATAAIARMLTEQKVSVLDVAARVADISEALRAEMAGEFGKFGIELVNFYLMQISVPEDDPSVQDLRRSLSKRADMQLRGYTYQQERSFDTLERAAENEGTAGGVMGAGMGLGMGFGVGGAVGNLMQDVLGQTRQPARRCASCGGAVAAEARFCPLCGGSCAEGVQPKKEAKCNRCGRTIPDGSKFCPGCGDPYNPCPSCGADVQEGETTCPVCGKPMPVACPACGVSVPAGSKFCTDCGKPVGRSCSSCGAEAGPGQAFCGKCGTKIE